MACCCSKHFSPHQRLQVGSKELSPLKALSYLERNFLNMPSQLSYISLEGTGSQGRPGNQAKGNGVGSAGVGRAHGLPNKIRTFRKEEVRREWLLDAADHACPMCET